jgi:hypothetical protein
MSIRREVGSDGWSDPRRQALCGPAAGAGAMMEKGPVASGRQFGSVLNKLWFLSTCFGMIFCNILLDQKTALAEEIAPNFSFNAYLTQAYGKTDGGAVFGLTEEGTSEYRSGALLLRYQVSERGQFVVQLATEEIGASPLSDLRDELELDWAFYEQQFGASSQVRVGRVPIPFGIYNEIRDVGTLLEFYRPPVGIYFEGAFSSETVDGLALSHAFAPERAWNLEVDLYAGSWDRAEYLAPTYYEGRAEDAYGFQLWLNTPVSGVRIGAAYQHFDQHDGAFFLRAGDADPFDTYLLSFDADLSRFFLRAEVQEIDTRFAGFPDSEINAFYALVGFRATDRLAFHVLYEDSKSTLGGGIGPDFEADPFYEDLAASIVYRITPQVVARLEGHQFETTAADVALPLGQGSIATDFWILSLSASF